MRSIKRNNMTDIAHILLVIVYNLLYVYFVILVVAILLSWTPLIHTKFYGFIEKITDPFLNIFRGYIIIGQFDLTPTLGIFLYYLLLTFMQRLL
ncbi:MAG: YggT family protein [Firmicutes bacterium]|nr:YggT family protein [Bacillota bacterium]